MLEDMAGLPQVLIDARALRNPTAAALADHVEQREPANEPVALPIEPEAIVAEADVQAALAVVAALPEQVADENQTTLFG
jgi:hypothetical protein